ncbi:hypothetical protein Tsubulata_022051 [Turnera subulata]|uniref:Uncharacterized protein n=1 Tax=Turnera subulata TaxID=218843 RepID=A0A9Q0G0Z0_9ROSI|nr:hypothetical protein Tsubulata_022051 [Turnera subulata]
MDKASTITTLTTRRPKWQYPLVPPTPRILHLPRRPRSTRKPPQQKTNVAKPSSQRDRIGKLETLFDQERGFARDAMPVVMVSSSGADYARCEVERRERVEEREENVVVVEEEKWRFQAEMLRAECNLLRMEREIAVKKMERRTVQMERILRSAIQTLVSGRQRIRDGKNVSLVLDEEIQILVEKLEKFQRRSGVLDLEARKCSNFDKQACVLQRRLEKFGGELDEICTKEIQEIAEAGLSIKNTCSSQDQSFVSNCSYNVLLNSTLLLSLFYVIMEILKSKMEGLSMETLLERMEDEYGSVFSTATSSASSSRRIEYPDMSLSSVGLERKEKQQQEGRPCSGCCKAVVRRVVEQVRAETEQWSQMQEMLGQVRDEMEELQASRDFWEDRALDSDYQMESLRSAVQEWKQKALSSEVKANELQAEVSMLSREVERLKKERAAEVARARLPPLSMDAPNEMEKRVLVCHTKENVSTILLGGRKHKEAFIGGSRKPNRENTSGLKAPKRSPFREIENTPQLVRQNSRAVFPLHCPLPSNAHQ